MYERFVSLLHAGFRCSKSKKRNHACLLSDMHIFLLHPIHYFLLLCYGPLHTHTRKSAMYVCM